MSKSNNLYHRNILDTIEYSNHPMYTDRLLGRMQFPNKWMISIVKHSVLNLFDITISRNQKFVYDLPIENTNVLNETEYLQKSQVEYIVMKISQL
jgi:hypothetical protein